MAHSTFSASAAHRWSRCPGSLVLGADAPDNSSIHAATGTVAHMVLDVCLKHGHDPVRFLGHVERQDGFDIAVDQAIVDSVTAAMQHVRDVTAGHDYFLTETQVNYSGVLGVATELAWGTADVIAICGDELVVVDFKNGAGVPVAAEDNEQMLCYAAGALAEYGELARIERVRMVISQPKVSASPSEWVLSVDELHDRMAELAAQAKRCTAALSDQSPAWKAIYLEPGEKQCRWCPAKATCPALRDHVSATVGDMTAASPDEFELLQPRTTPPADTGISDEQWLAACMAKADLVEDWVRSVRAEVERRLLAGSPVNGFKLVQGRRGARAWRDVAAAETYLRTTVRLPAEKVFEHKLISPTSAEKLVKAGDLTERQWAKLTELVHQPEGKPSVAPSSDPRPAIDVSPVAADFDVI